MSTKTRSLEMRGFRLRAGLLSLSLMLASGGAACRREGSRNKGVVATAQPVAAAAGSGAVVPSHAKYRFSGKDSSIKFVGANLLTKQEGSFATFDGVIQVDDGNPLKSSVSVDIDTASLQTDNPKLTSHLKSADFLDVARFPKAHFASIGVKTGGEMAATETVVGNLELRGVTRAISLPGTVHIRPDGVDVDADVILNRKDFGITYPGAPDNLIKDEVRLTLTIHADRT